jgi:hypothetical protein
VGGVATRADGRGAGELEASGEGVPDAHEAPKTAERTSFANPVVVPKALPTRTIAVE